MRAKLESVERQTGIRPKELDDLKELPESMVFVWGYFLRLHSKRTSNGYGVNPIQYSEVLAFFQLQGFMPAEWEVEVIMQLDSVAISAYAKAAEKEQAKNKAKSKTKR